MAMNNQCGCEETGPEFCCKCADMKDGYYMNVDNDDLESYADALKKENNALRKNNEALTKQVAELEERLEDMKYSLINTTSLYQHYKMLAEGDSSDEFGQYLNLMEDLQKENEK